jgi:hypothetical protein
MPAFNDASGITSTIAAAARASLENVIGVSVPV